MKELSVLVRKELLEQFGTKKILVLFGIFIFIAISSPIIAKLTPELLKSINVPGMTINLPKPTYKDSIDQLIKNISQIGLLVVIFISAGAISDEKTRRTLEIILTKPISRNKFIISKFLGYSLSISITFIFSCLIFFAYTITTFSGFDLANFLIASLMLLWYILMITSVTISASSLINNSIVAGCLGLLCYLLFGFIFNLSEITHKYSPNIAISSFQGIVQNGLNDDLAMPIMTITAMTITAISLSIIFFRKQEIER